VCIVRNLLKIFLLTVFLFSGTVEAKCDIDSLYNQFNSENISQNEIKQWVSQFDSEDQDAAVLLLEQIQYFSYKRLMADLKLLHKNLLSKLKIDGFIENPEKELVFETIDFSKTYPAKSGDLISYFYRSSNIIRAVSFKNLSDLSASAINSNKALVILEDYVGTGTQFLFELYSKRHHELFNSYKKVYLVTLVANKNAVRRFEKITNGDSLAQDFIAIMNIQDENAKKEAQENVRKIPKDKLEVIYLHKEIPLNDSLRDPETTSKLFALLDKYNIKRYLGGNFSSFGHTVFFYNCPNNLPEILWNSQSIHRDGTPWTPLFKRVEDLSIYDISKTIPIEEQIW
jgi:hypothetical protein